MNNEDRRSYFRTIVNCAILGSNACQKSPSIWIFAKLNLQLLNDISNTGIQRCIYMQGKVAIARTMLDSSVYSLWRPKRHS